MNALIDDLIAFAAAHPWSPHWPPDTIRRFCTTLISSPDFILDLRQDGERLIAGVLIDRIDNPSRHASLEILGIAGESFPLIGRLIESAAVRRPPGKIGFDVTFSGSLVLSEAWLAAHRLRPEYQGFSMLLPAMPLPKETDTAVTAATPEDFGEIYDVMAAAFSQNRDTHVPPRDEWLARRLANPYDTILIRREAGAIAGYIHFSREGSAGDINTIGVLPTFRRRGIARDLLTTALSQLANRWRHKLPIGCRRAERKGAGAVSRSRLYRRQNHPDFFKIIRHCLTPSPRAAAGR